MKSISKSGDVLGAIRSVLTPVGIRLGAPKPASNHNFGDVEIPVVSQNLGLIAEYKPALTTHAVQLLAQRASASGSGKVPVLCVRNASWPVIEACKRAKIGIVDGQGNGYLQWPGFYYERYRPAPSTTATGTSGTVFTSKATRISRALLANYPKPWRQRELVEATETSAGYVSKLVKRLEQEGYVAVRNGEVRLLQPDRLLDDWCASYRFDRHCRVGYAMSAPTYENGIEKLAKALTLAGSRFAFTGWTGGAIRAPFAMASTYMAYIDHAPEESGVLFPETDKPNVLLYVPADFGVFQFANESDYGPVVCDAQLYVDLARMPGRAREQADALRLERLDFGGNP